MLLQILFNVIHINTLRRRIMQLEFGKCSTVMASSLFNGSKPIPLYEQTMMTAMTAMTAMTTRGLWAT